MMGGLNNVNRKQKALQLEVVQPTSVKRASALIFGGFCPDSYWWYFHLFYSFLPVPAI